MTQIIAHNRPLITAEDQAAVAEALASGWVAQGPRVEGLEADFQAMLGGGEGCALSSGTAALFLALHGLAVKSGDVVALPTYTCSALLNAIHMAGAVPQPVDVKLDDFTLDPERLPRQAKVAMAVHCYGASADVAGLKQHGARVIEDCCQSLGGPQGGAGDAAVFSFYATKIITGGQGGMVTDPTGEVAARARDYREFDCRESYAPRFNLQMTDIQAAMIRSQFSRLGAIKARRRKIYAAYLEALGGREKVQAGLGDQALLPYRFVIRTEDEARRDRLLTHFKESGVGVIIPLERYELLHRYLGLDPYDFPNAERLADTTLSLPLYPALADAEVERVSRALKEIP